MDRSEIANAYFTNLEEHMRLREQMKNANLRHSRQVTKTALSSEGEVRRTAARLDKGLPLQPRDLANLDYKWPELQEIVQKAEENMGKKESRPCARNECENYSLRYMDSPVCVKHATAEESAKNAELSAIEEQIVLEKVNERLLDKAAVSL